MIARTHLVRLITTVLILLTPCLSSADEIRVAVASNFKHAMTSLVREFEATSDHKVTMAIGSSGKHYAQIVNGAPYDIFFSADLVRPQLLDNAGVALPGSRFTYAIGRLVLWSPRTDYIDANGDILSRGKFRYLAMANPRLAPYGMAAQQVLLALGLDEKLKGCLIRGENIGQAFHFVKSGNAELGFVAWSQVKRPGQPIEGSYWEPPSSTYSPIEQQAVLLKDKEATRAFLAFMKGAEAVKIIQDHGYSTP